MMLQLHQMQLTNQWNTEPAPFNHESTNYLASVKLGRRESLSLIIISSLDWMRSVVLCHILHFSLCSGYVFCKGMYHSTINKLSVLRLLLMCFFNKLYLMSKL